MFEKYYLTNSRFTFVSENESSVPFEANLQTFPTWKRILDLSVLILAMPLYIPVMLLIGLLIKCVSSGPIFYRQERIGFNGKIFWLFKFRTMKVGSDTSVHQSHFIQLMQSNEPMKKIDLKDNRLIPFGLFLRTTGLDELAQIINVFKGEMSLVGPRPCLPYEYLHYLPEQKKRCASVPGIAGLWQVSGKNKTTFEEMIHLDIFYIRNMNLFLDLVILLKTIPALLVQIYETKIEKRKSELQMASRKKPDLAEPEPVVQTT